MDEQARATIGDVPVYCSYTELMDIDRMIENPRNPNKHPEAQIKLLARIIKVQGWRAPITVSDRSGFIVKGHGRLAAARISGQKQVPVDRQHYESEAEEWADMLADNRLSELSQIDNTMLADVLQEVDTGEIDILLTGYTEDDLKNLIESLSGANDTDAASKEDSLPAAPKDIVTQPGDLWILGQHRLLCGDATNPDHVRRVMRGDKAQMVFTDPPYGVSYTGVDGCKQWDMLRNDNQTGDDLVNKLLLPAFRLMTEIVSEGAAFYIWHASSTREDFAWAMKKAGILEDEYIIWVKNNFVMGHADYHWMHEPCFYGHKAGESIKYYGDRTQTTVWRATLSKDGYAATTLGQGVVLTNGEGQKIFISPKPPKGKKIRHIRMEEEMTIELITDNLNTDVWEIDKATQIEHPTQKPVELARRAIENSTKSGEIVWDSFMGSGTTLIGAELTGRIAYGTELNPEFCDLVVKRWEKIAGKQAERINAAGEAVSLNG